MDVLVTGASGHVASQVVPELLAAGHAVTGLVRSDRAEEAVRSLGASTVRGDLADLDVLRREGSRADGVVHLAFDIAAQRAGHLDDAVATDLAAVDALVEALAGSGRPLVVTSATGALPLAGFRGTLREDDGLATGFRTTAETRVLAAARRDVRSVVVRLPPTVHGTGRHGFASSLLQTAAATGFSGYLGEGANRWPSVGLGDVATLYRHALERGPAGSRWHAVAEEGIALRDIAAAVGHRLGVPVRPVPDADAAAHFGELLPFVAMDNPTSGERTRREMGWDPRDPGLLEDLRTTGTA